MFHARNRNWAQLAESNDGDWASDRLQIIWSQSQPVSHMANITDLWRFYPHSTLATRTTKQPPDYRPDEKDLADFTAGRPQQAVAAAVCFTFKQPCRQIHSNYYSQISLTETGRVRETWNRNSNGQSLAKVNNFIDVLIKVSETRFNRNIKTRIMKSCTISLFYLWTIWFYW